MSINLFKVLLRRGGISAVRDVVSALRKIISKQLHPDLLGGIEDETYKKFLSATTNIIDAAEDDLRNAIKDSRAKDFAEDKTSAKTAYDYRNVPGKILSEIASLGAHIPDAVDVIFEIYPLDFGVIRKNYDIKISKFGIFYRESSTETWLEEKGMFIIGSCDRKLDGEFKKALNYNRFMKRGIPNLPGTTTKDSPIMRFSLGKYYERIEAYYSPKLSENRSLICSNDRFEILHLGHIKRRIAPS